MRWRRRGNLKNQDIDKWVVLRDGEQGSERRRVRWTDENKESSTHHSAWCAGRTTAQSSQWADEWWLNITAVCEEELRGCRRKDVKVVIKAGADRLRWGKKCRHEGKTSERAGEEE